MDWSQIKVSTDFTHHLKDDIPLYDERFDEVLKFHTPGLAPVKKDQKAWHINRDGKPGYVERYLRTFGFYEGLASVFDSSGAFHIHPNGKPAYKDRYSWTGNFQETLCSVRTNEGYYQHIDSNGLKIGTEVWSYAGDYKDDIAVVQREDGLSSHVDFRGEIIHDRWFYDLDIFHKGYARAKDTSGWVHIDRLGRPLYHQRYSMIELFYNGQARVETIEGSLLVIDEAGCVLKILRSGRDPFHELSGDLVGFWKTHTISTAVEIGIFEILPDVMGNITQKLNITPEKCNRLLNALWDLNICIPIGTNRWELTRKGELLRQNNQYSLADASIQYAKELEPCWFDLKKAIMADNCWVPETDIFLDVCRKTKILQQHHNMLSSYALYDYSSVVPLLPIKNGQSVVDVGGGAGILSSLIKQFFPESKITLIDLPEIIERVSETTGINFVPLNFFEPWNMSVDIVIMARILHDWNDAKAEIILKHACASIVPGGKLIILEMILDDHKPGGHLCDLHLLAVTGGGERTIQEYEKLLNRCGFSICNIVSGSGIISVIEAHPSE
ncbi:MAG: methyltransferase [Desulfobacteraceae bacterium]